MHAISHAIVEEFAEQAATVLMCYLDEAEINDYAREWKTKGFKITGSVCDVSEREERKKLMKQVSSLFNGKLNIVLYSS